MKKQKTREGEAQVERCQYQRIGESEIDLHDDGRSIRPSVSDVGNEIVDRSRLIQQFPQLAPAHLTTVIFIPPILLESLP